MTGKYRAVAHGISNSRLNVANEIPVIFHNGWNHNYYYHKRIDKFVFLNVLEKIRTKYKTFSVSIKKEIRKVEKDGNEVFTTDFYKIKFMNIPRFIASSSSDSVDHLAEEIHKVKCKDFDWFWIRKSNYQFHKI